MRSAVTDLHLSLQTSHVAGGLRWNFDFAASTKSVQESVSKGVDNGSLIGYSFLKYKPSVGL